MIVRLRSSIDPVSLERLDNTLARLVRIPGRLGWSVGINVIAFSFAEIARLMSSNIPVRRNRRSRLLLRLLMYMARLGRSGGGNKHNFVHCCKCTVEIIHGSHPHE